MQKIEIINSCLGFHSEIVQSTVVSKSFGDVVIGEIKKLRDANSQFQEAYDTYVQQYGEQRIVVSPATNLSGSIDPTIMVFGRNCFVWYNDSSKLLCGRIGSITLQKAKIYLIGRREPQDSKLVIWNSAGDSTDLDEYNSQADTIPSRIHGAVGYLDDAQILYSDIGSSAGTIIVGQSPVMGGAFMRAYDPGLEESPSIKFSRVFTRKAD